jgi:hypothetical protein
MFNVVAKQTNYIPQTWLGYFNSVAFTERSGPSHAVVNFVREEISEFTYGLSNHELLMETITVIYLQCVE